MFYLKYAIVILLSLSAPSMAAGDVVLGTWQSPPDHKEQIGHMLLRPCGVSVCGKLITAFDKTGKEVTTPNVGRDMIWDMKARGDGSYSGGEVYVPLFNANFPADLKLKGDKLTVRGCNSVGLCKSQIWTRVR